MRVYDWEEESEPQRMEAMNSRAGLIGTSGTRALPDLSPIKTRCASYFAASCSASSWTFRFTFPPLDFIFRSQVL